MYGQGNYTPQFSHGPPTPPPPFQQAPPPPPPPFQQGQGPPAPVPPMFQHAPAMPPRVHIPPPGMANFGQQHYLHPPPPSIHGNAPITASYPTARQALPYPPHITTQNVHHVQTSVLPPPGPSLPPRGLPPPPPSQGQLMYRTPPPPPPVGFVPITPLPFASSINSSIGDAHPPSTPPPPPPPPPSSPPPLPPSPPPLLVSPPPNLPASASEMSHMFPSSIALDTSHCLDSGRLLDNVEITPVDKVVDSALVMDDALIHGASQHVEGAATSGEMDSMVADGWSSTAQALKDFPLPPSKPVEEEVVRNIEVLCQFIAKVGPNFEDLARTKEAGNPKFAFLFGGEPGTAAAIGHEYFQWVKGKCLLELKLQDELKEGDLSLRPSQMVTSPQPQIPSDEGVSISPAASDMDVEEANLSTVARPFNKALSPVQVIPEVTDCILVSNMPESARPLREDISLVKVSTASMEGTIENLPRPLKLIEDYSSDDSGEDDKRQCIEEDAVARDSPMVTLGTSGLHENKGSNLESNLCSENVSVTEMGSKSPIELNPVCVSSLPFTTTEAVQCPDGSPTSHKVGSPNVVVSDLLDEITKTDELGIHRDSDKKLDHRSGSAQSTLHNDAVQDDVDMDPHGGRLHQRKDGKQASTVLNVDEFGRLVREGASDSDSDGMHYTERHGKRDRSRSRSPQESRWRRRRSRSPWRRKDKRSRSRSWSPKRQRSRSRSPSAFRRAGEYGSENTRKDRGQPPVCFDFLRGRCYRGAFCRYLHRDSDKGDAPRQYRIKQREYQENPQDLRNSIVSGDTQTTVEPCEANNIVTEVSVDVHSTLLKEEVKSHEIPSGKDISDGDVISSNNGRNSIVSGDTQTTVEPCEANNIVTEVSVDEHSTVLKEEVKSQEIPSGKDISDGDLVSSNNGDLGEGTESGSIGDEFQPTISAEVGQSPATMNGGEIGQPQGLEETSTQVQELQLFQQAPEKEMSEHLPGEMPLDQLFLGEISVVHISQEKVPDSPIQLGFPNSSPHPENAGTIAEVQEPQQFQQVPMEPSVHPPENENSQQLPSQTHPDQPKLGEMPVVQISQDNVPDSPGSPKFENSFPHPENAESSSVSHPLPVETSTTLPNQLPVTQLYPSQVPPISQPYPNHAMSQAYPNQVPTIQPFPPEGFRPQPLPPQEVHLRNYSTEDFKFQPSQLPPPPQLQRPQPPVGMLPPYQLPLDNYHSQHVPPPNPSWTHLPPPPPPSANSLQFHQNLMPPSNDLNRQPMARPFPLEELTHSKVASFHPQTFVPMERSHWPPMHRNSPLGSTSFVREERFMQHAMPESKQFVPDATQNNYHLHHQDIQPPQDPRIGSQFSGQGIASSSGFNQADIHSQSVSFPRESPAVPLQSFPGNNLPPRSFSREDFGAPSQRSYGLQRPVDDGLFSHFGAPLSRYPSQILENNLPPRSSDVADSKLSTSTHFNPYASTFEQTSTTSKFASGVVRREIDTNYGNKYDPHFNPSYVSVAGQGIGGGPGSRPTALSPDSRRLRSSNSLPIAPLGELNDRAYPQEPSVHRQFVRERASADQYDPLFDSIEPSSNNRFSELDGVQMQNPNVHVGIDREVISRLGSLHGQPLDVEENNKKKEGADTVIKSLENEEFGETGIDAEVGAVENVSPSYPIDLPNAAMGEIEIDQVQPSGKKKKSKDARSMKLFKIAIADFVKEVLKPSWRQGNMSKEAFKTIVKKTVDKVSGAMQSHQIPKSQVKINQYVDSSQKKLTKLVMGYVDKYVNN